MLICPTLLLSTLAKVMLRRVNVAWLPGSPICAEGSLGWVFLSPAVRRGRAPSGRWTRLWIPFAPKAALDRSFGAQLRQRKLQVRVALQQRRVLFPQGRIIGTREAGGVSCRCERRLQARDAASQCAPLPLVRIPWSISVITSTQDRGSKALVRLLEL